MKIIDKVEYFGRRAEICFSSSRRGRRNYYLVYTLLYLVFMGIIGAAYVYAGKSFIWGPYGDGMRQHYTSLVYLGEYLRDILYNIFVEHTFEIPMWDLHIGYGSDIVTTLHYYTLGDPLNLLSVLVPQRYTEYLYDFLLMLRIYLSGAAFSIYCRYHGNKPLPTLLGACIYAFSGWNMVAGFKHPFFINPCIYLPLLLLGVDKIFKKEKPYLYMSMVGISCISNFYFFYMLTIFMVLYAAYRYFMLFGKIRVKEWLGWIGRFAGYGAVGLGCACVLFLPVAAAFLETGRADADVYVQSAYSAEHYQMLVGALSGKYLSSYTIIGVSAVCLPALLILFLNRGKNLALKIGFIMCCIFLCVPYIAHVFNGFSYATNRWCWAFVMLLAYIFVKVFPDFFTLSKKQKIALGLCTAAYCLYILADPYARDGWNVLTALLFLGAAGTLLLGYAFWQRHKACWSVFLTLAMSCSILVNISYSYSEKGNDQSSIRWFVPIGEAYSEIYEPIQKTVKSFSDEEDYRFEQESSGVHYNSAMVTELNGGQFFFSLANGNVSRFLSDICLNKPLEQKFQNMDERAYLMKLLSMKYFAGSQRTVPYGYEKAASSGEGLPSVYADEDALPLAYTYDSYIPVEEYEKMDGIERQEAMLQGVVLEDSQLPKCEAEINAEEADYEITDLKNIELSDKGFQVLADNASLVLRVDGRSDCETNVVFENLEYEGGSSKLSILLNTKADGKKIGKKILFYTEENNFYTGRKDFISNLNYHQEPVTSVKLTFEKKGNYRYDELKVVCQPLDRLASYTEDRKEDLAENLTINGGNVSCRIRLEEAKALVFSLPYGNGWNALVNGEKAEIKKANTAFMALELPPGEYEIELHYTTPFIKSGLLLSLCSVVIFIVIVIMKEKRKRKTK